MTERRFTGQGNRVEFARLSWASGETSAVTDWKGGITMIVERIDVIVSNATNAITFAATFTDENGVEPIVSTNFATVAENAATVKFATLASPDFPAAMLVNNDITLSLTPSGDPGASGATVDVIMYGV